MHPPGWKVGGDTHPIPEKSLGKVMTRDWYAENKHIFPASKWTQFDPLIMQEHQHQGSGVQISFQEKVELLLKARNNRLTRRR